MALEQCWCGHARSSHVNGKCATCLELGENHPHEYKLDPALLATSPKPGPRGDSGRFESRFITVDDLPGFIVAPPRVLGQIEPEPTDATKVFVVEAGQYEDRGILAVFVGNRVLAYTFAAEHNRYVSDRYDEAFVTEWPDTAFSRHAGSILHPTIFTQIKYTTLIRAGRAGNQPDVWNRVESTAAVDTGCDHDLFTEVDQGDGRIEIITRSADTDGDRARAQHAEFVNKWLKSEVNQ